MKNVFVLMFTATIFQLFGADNTWQKGAYDSLSGNWDEAGHWSGGVPVAAPPTGEGAYQQRVVFPAGSYTVTFPEGKTVSTANMTLTLANNNAITMSGLGSTLLLAATDENNYQVGDIKQAFRFNYNGGNQGYNVTVTDMKAPLACLSAFNVTMSRDDTTCKMILDGGLYDFLAPTGGTRRTDTTVTAGYEGLNGGYTADHVFLTEVKNGASLRTPKLSLGSGFAENTFSFSGSSNVVGVLSLNGTKAGSNRALMKVEVKDGAFLDVGDASSSTSLQLSGDTATYAPYTTQVEVSGGSTLLTRYKTFLRKGWPTLAVVGGSNWQADNRVSISDISSSTGCVSIVDSTANFGEDITIGNVYAKNGEMVGCLVASNSTVDVAGTLEVRPESKAVFGGGQGLVTVNGSVIVGTSDNSVGVPAELQITGGSVAFKGAVILGDKKSSGTLTVDGGTATLAKGLTLSAATAAGYISRLVMNGGRLVLPDSKSVSLNSYNAGTAYVDLNGGTVRAKSVTRGAPSSTTGFTANGGTIEATSTEACLSGMQTAVLGEKGLTIDSAFDQTLEQNFTSADGVLGKLVYVGASTLTVPAGRMIDAALWMKGGTTLAYGGARLGGLVLGEADGVATVNVTIGSPIAVTGDVDVRQVRLVITGACETGATYPLVTCTGDASAGTAAAWEAAELVASFAPEQYAELSVADGAEGGKVLQMTVKEMKVVPLVLASGEETVSTNITLGMYDQLEVTVGEGAVLTLAGVVTGDSIVKKGTGKLVVGNAENMLATGFYLADGLLSAPTAAALGDGTGYLSGGTLEVTGDTAFSRSLVITPANDAQAVVVKTEADVTMPLPQASVGAFLKRGTGKLTLTVAESTSAFAPKSVGGNRTATVVSFPESGVVPVAAYYSVHVIEGELAFKGLADDVVVTMPNSFAVGLNTLDGTVAPKLTLDHVAVAASGCMVDNAGYMTKDGSFCQKTFVALKNGAALSVANVYNGRSTKNQGITTEVTVEDSTITATAAYWVNDSDGTNIPLNTFRNSNVYCAAFGVQGCGGTNVFDNCVVAKNANGDGVTLQQQDNKTSYFLFRNGTVFRHSTLNCNTDRTGYPNAPYIFAFDGATWDMGAKNVAYTNVTSVSPKRGITLYDVHSIGEGVTFNPGEGYTWSLRLQKPILGNGKILVKGAGTLDLNGETYENAKIGGTGTLRNVALAGTKLTVCADVEAAGALTLGEDVTCTATKGCVDFGRTEADPLPYKDLSYPLAVLNAGPVTIPGAAAWRVANTCVRGLKGCFAEDSGVLSLTGLDVTGLMLIFR